jgi:hypothetical protein
MNEQMSWTPTERLLFVCVVPAVAVVGGLLLFAAIRSEARSEPELTPAQTRAAAAEQAREQARDAARKAYAECLESMGADIGMPRMRGRFSPRPDMSKIREAMSMCQTVLRNAGTPPSRARDPAPLPIA